MYQIQDRFTGIIACLSAENYHTCPAIGSSHIKAASRSLAHYQASRGWDEDISSAKRESFNLGTCAHSVILEGSTDGFLKGPEVSSKAVKAWKEFVDANPDKIVVTPTDYARIIAMYGAFQRQPNARRLIENGLAENSFFAVDHQTGLWVKARPDSISKSYEVIVDYKTTAKGANKHAFTNTMAQLQYDISAAHYSSVVESVTGVRPREFYWIVQETSAPYELMVYKARPQMIAGAEMTRQALLSQILHAEKSNEFPGYPVEVQEIDLPTWAIDEQATRFGDIA